MDIAHNKMLPLLIAMALCLRVTNAHLIAAFPAPPPPVPVPIQSIPVFATHTKLVPHTLPTGGAILAPGPHGTAALIGPIGDGAIVAAPINGHHPPHFVTHQLVPYTVAAGVPTAIPLKLLFTRFPPFIEAIVQRIQNYFSTYNVENGSYPDSPPQNDPAPTTTPTTPAPTSTTTTEAPTRATTVPPLPANEGSQTANGIYGHQNNYDNPPLQAFDRLEDSYRYDSPESRPFRYPKTGFPEIHTSRYLPSTTMIRCLLQV